MASNKHLIILLILFFSFYIHECKAQDWNQQKTEFAFVNIGVNGILGGLGALVHKKNGEIPHKVFLKGFSQGCLGGAVSFAAKKLTYTINSQQNLSYAWAARITNSVGNSITQNAMSNVNFWENWHFNLYFFRFDYQLSNKKFQARLFPSSVYGAINLGRQGKFNFKKSIQSGIMIFESDRPILINGTNAQGGAQVSTIAVYNNLPKAEHFALLAHETMHILQYENMVWGNALLTKVDTRLKSKSSFYKSLSKYVYFDLNGLTILGLYYTQISRPWICRYIEREAEHFSQRVTLPDCN